MNNVNAIILAGGKSRRFGTDKALVEIEGQPLILSLVQRLQKVFCKVIVSLSRVNNYSFLERVSFVKDTFPEKGPLSGLHACLINSDSEYNFVCGCDMPLLSLEYMKYMKSMALKKTDYDLIVPFYNGFYEPLAAVYGRKCIKLIEAELLNNNLKLSSFYRNVNMQTISSKHLSKFGGPEKLFLNLNHLSDLKNYTDKTTKNITTPI